MKAVHDEGLMESRTADLHRYETDPTESAAACRHARAPIRSEESRQKIANQDERSSLHSREKETAG